MDITFSVIALKRSPLNLSFQIAYATRRIMIARNCLHVVPLESDAALEVVVDPSSA